MPALRNVLYVIAIVLIVYQVGLNLIYLFLLAVAGWSLRSHLHAAPAVWTEEVFASPLTPGVSLLIPAYNEELCIETSVTSFLGLRYPDLQLIIANDGSDDSTLERLIKTFDLVAIERLVPDVLETAPIRSVMRSRNHPNLLVIDKENGGRADALNAGLLFADRPLVCAADADSILETDALLRVTAPFVQDPERTIGVGGIIRLVNDCKVAGGQVVEVRLAKNPWVRFQVLEYLRSFLIGRLGWSAMNAMLLVSGAFGVWRRDRVIEAGGYDASTLGEDAELTMRMHRYMRSRKIDYRITFVPDPVCWTEAPSSARILARQRRRWSRGMGETLWLNRAMAFNPRYGIVGIFAYPYYLIYEFLGAVIELAGMIALPLLLVFGFSDAWLLIGVFVLSMLFGALLTSSGVLLEEFTYRRYSRWRDVFALIGYSLIETFGFHQAHVIWRCQGIWDLIARRRQRWGAMEHSGFGDRQFR